MGACRTGAARAPSSRGGEGRAARRGLCEEGQRPAHRSRQAPALNTLRWSRRKTHGFANRVWGALTRFRVRGGHVVVESCARPDDLEELILGLVAAGRAAIRHCARATRRARAAGRRRRRRTTRPRATSEDGSAEATRPVGQPASCSASRLTIDFVHPTGAYPGARSGYRRCGRLCGPWQLLCAPPDLSRTSASRRRSPQRRSVPARTPQSRTSCRLLAPRGLILTRPSTGSAAHGLVPLSPGPVSSRART